MCPRRGLPKLCAGSLLSQVAHLRGRQCLLPARGRSSYQEGAWGCRNHLSTLKGSLHLTAGISAVLSLTVPTYFPPALAKCCLWSTWGPQIRWANGRAEGSKALPPRASPPSPHQAAVPGCCSTVTFYGDAVAWGAFGLTMRSSFSHVIERNFWLGTGMSAVRGAWTPSSCSRIQW